LTDHEFGKKYGLTNCAFGIKIDLTDQIFGTKAIRQIVIERIFTTPNFCA